MCALWILIVASQVHSSAFGHTRPSKERHYQHDGSQNWSQDAFHYSKGMCKKRVPSSLLIRLTWRRALVWLSIFMEFIKTRNFGPNHWRWLMLLSESCLRLRFLKVRVAADPSDWILCHCSSILIDLHQFSLKKNKNFSVFSFFFSILETNVGADFCRFWLGLAPVWGSGSLLSRAVW